MLRLRDGVRWCVEVEQHADGSYTLHHVSRVGRGRPVPRGAPVHLANEEALWMHWETFGQEQLAALGLEKMP